MRLIIIYISVIVIGCSSQPEHITVYTIGDSTMANKPDPDNNPERGWAQMLQPFFTEDVTIDNRAVNGRSTKSFRVLGHWEAVHSILTKGDYLFIQFGHNDSKIKDPQRHTNPHSTYRHNLIKYIEETRAKGATPILFSSIVRRKFNEYGVLVDTHDAYTLEARLVAQQYDVPFVDLQYYTELLEEAYGVEGSKSLHLHYEAGENSYLPEGEKDNTHLSILGATEIAKLAVKELDKLDISLADKIIDQD